MFCWPRSKKTIRTLQLISHRSVFGTHLTRWSPEPAGIWWHQRIMTYIMCGLHCRVIAGVELLWQKMICSKEFTRGGAVSNAFNTWFGTYIFTLNYCKNITIVYLKKVNHNQKAYIYQLYKTLAFGIGIGIFIGRLRWQEISCKNPDRSIWRKHKMNKIKDRSHFLLIQKKTLKWLFNNIVTVYAWDGFVIYHVKLRNRVCSDAV